MNQQMHNWSTIYYSALYDTALLVSALLRHLRGAPSQYLLGYVSVWMQYLWYILKLRIPRQNNFIIARAVLTFLIILNIDNKTYVKF